MTITLEILEGLEWVYATYLETWMPYVKLNDVRVISFDVRQTLCGKDAYW